VTIEEAFAKVVGRPASEPERERLHRLRDALGLRDNDAFWSIVMALEYYDSFFRQYPARLAEQTSRCIEGARGAFAAAAGREAARMQRVLAETVAKTSLEIARKRADRPFPLPWMTTALALVVAFGALCVNAGYHLASPEPPHWLGREPRFTVAERALSMVLALPAGWMVLALLVPAAAHGVRVGWGMATDGTAEAGQKVAGWSLAAACAGGCVACAVLLAKIT
jgi:hypothetical protein